MKALTAMIALALIAGAPVTLAENSEQDHSAHHPPPGSETEAAQPAGHEHGAGKASPLQQNMTRIESLMEQCRQATDPARKRELLGQHLQALQQQMRLVVSERAAMKMSMKEGAATDAGAPDATPKEGGMMKGGMMKGGMMMMHKQVEERMGLIERLLQQVIEREAVEAELEAH